LPKLAQAYDEAGRPTMRLQRIDRRSKSSPPLITTTTWAVFSAEQEKIENHDGFQKSAEMDPPTRRKRGSTMELCFPTQPLQGSR